MDTTKATSDVFRDGSEHLVGGVLIKVQPFHQRSSRDDEDDDGDDDGQTLDLLTDDEGWEDSPSFTTTLQDDADAAPPAAPPSTFQGSRTSAERGFRAALLRDRGERLDGCGVRAAAANRGRFARASSPTGFAAANRADAPKTGAGLLERYFGQAGPVHGEGGGNAALAAYSGFDQGGRDRMQGPGEQRPNQRRAAAADHPETQPWDLWQYFSEADLCQAMPDHYRD